MQHAEQVLLEHLTETDGLEILSREGFHQETSRAVIPTELVRKITAWAVDYYWANGRKVAPSQDAVLEVWGEQMEVMEVEFGDPTDEIDSIEWVIDSLRATYAGSETHKLLREVAVDLSRADSPEKVAVIAEAAHKFYQLSQRLQSRSQESAGGPGFDDAIRRYDDREMNGHTTQGMLLGIPEIDAHTYGIHPGELAIFAASTGVGKSWLAGRTVLQEWQRGRRISLFTLENDLPMTFDRLVCMACRVPYELWQRGEVTDAHKRLVSDLTDKMEASENQPVILQPDLGARDPVSIVRKALTLGSESLVVDQTSFIEPVPGSKARERHYQVAEILRVIRDEIRRGPEKLPLLLLAQINRDGRERAKKAGRYEFNDLALSSELENIADFVWAGYQSADMEATDRALWQEMKFRRGKKQDWLMRWRLDVGDIRVIEKYQEEDA